MESPDINLIGKECKSFGTIEKIDKSKVNESCEYGINLKLNNNGKYYLFTGNGFDRNISDKTILNTTASSCDINGNYSFLEGQSPKVGDTIYLIAEYGYNHILKSGKDSYDINLNLPNCGQYIISFMDWSYNNPINYEIMEMCKVSGKIETLTKTPGWQNCYYDLKLKINHNNQVSYFYNTTEQIIDKDGNFCLGGEYMFPIHNSIGGKDYFPKKGDDFYGLADTKTNQLLKVGQTRYDQYNKLSDCTGETISSNSGELLSSNGTNISSNKIEINTGKILEQNISLTKKEIIIPKKIVKSSSNKSVQIIKNDIANSETVSGTIAKNTESNSGTSNSTGVSNKPFKTETGVVVKQLNNDLVYTSSNSGIYVILIILVSIISLIFIKKKF